MYVGKKGGGDFDLAEQKHDTIFFVSCFVWHRSGGGVLWDVFSTMRQKESGSETETDEKVNINFRCQNLSVWCRLKLTTGEKSSSVELLSARIAASCGRVCVRARQRTPCVR